MANTDSNTADQTSIGYCVDYLMLRFDRQTESFEDDTGEEYNLYDLGQDGWELVSISGWAFGKALAFFKRVKWKNLHFSPVGASLTEMVKSPYGTYRTSVEE